MRRHRIDQVKDRIRPLVSARGSDPGQQLDTLLWELSGALIAAGPSVSILESEAVEWLLRFWVKDEEYAHLLSELQDDIVELSRDDDENHWVILRFWPDSAASLLETAAHQLPWHEYERLHAVVRTMAASVRIKGEAENPLFTNPQLYKSSGVPAEIGRQPGTVSGGLPGSSRRRN